MSGSPTVTLRLVRPDDAATLAAAYRTNREFLAPFEPIRPEAFFTEAGQRERIAGLIAAEQADTGACWVVEVDGELSGTMTLSGIVRGPFQSGNLGYWIAQAQNGRGVATNAVGQALTAAFGPLGLHRVQAGTLLDNVGSQKVLARNGFSRIGVAPCYLRINGQWRDHVLFQRIADGVGPKATR